MKAYDVQYIANDKQPRKWDSEFTQAYLHLFSWINHDLNAMQTKDYFPLFDIIKKEIILAGASYYWAYGPSMAALQTVSLHPYAKHLNYRLEPHILVDEGVAIIRRCEHLLAALLEYWLEEMTSGHYYYIEQTQQLLAIVRQIAEQLELIQFAAVTELQCLTGDNDNIITFKRKG